MSEKHVKEIIKELQSETLHPELVQDNKLYFPCDDLLYLVRMPNQKE